MRGKQSKPAFRILSLISFVILGQLAAQAQPVEVIALTGTSWRYNQSNNLDGVMWMDPSYDDTQPGWQEGPALLSNDTGNGAIAPLIGTVINGPRVAAEGVVQHSYYFRTRFNWDSAPQPYLNLNFVTRIDDGAIIFLNGTEILRVSVDPGVPVQFASSDFANGYLCGGDADCDGVWSVTLETGSPLVQGENVLAAIVYQEGTDSSDITFGMRVTVVPPFAPIILDPGLPTNVVVLQNRSATLVSSIGGSPAPTYQWYVNDTLIADATNSTLIVTNELMGTSSSNFFVRASNPLGAIYSRTNTVIFTADTNAPVLLGAAGSASFTEVTVAFDEPLEINSAEDLFNYSIVDPSNVPLGISGTVLSPDRKSVVLTTDTQAEDTLYTLTVGGSGIGDLAGNILESGTTQFRSWVTINANGVIFEAYNGTAGPTIAGQITGNAVAVLTGHPSFINNTPSECTNIAAFDSRQVYPDDSHEAYGGRIRGLFIPPVSGLWRLYLRSDDASELWFNPNGSGSSGRTLVAQETGCCNAYLEPPAQQTSQPLNLVAGQGYYIETLYKEGTGGDYCQVAAKLEGDPTPAGNLMPLPAGWIGSGAAPSGVGGTFTITQQPASVQVVSGTTVTFRVGTSTSTPLYYQWQRDGADIIGATCETYTLTTSGSDNGARFSVRVAVMGGSSETSSEAVLTVGADVIRPTVVGFVVDGSGTNVTVSFSEPMDPTTSETAGNYLLDNQAVASATRVNGTNVVVALGTPLQPCVSHDLRISGVTDQAANLVNPNPTNITFMSPVLLVPLNATWRYDDTGNNLGTAWSAPGFDDSAWPMGPALLGYEPAATQIPPIATPISSIITNKTAYFRVHFNLAVGPAAITNLQLTEVVDDGAVYYLNGVEAHRTRMPAGAIDANTLASGSGPEPTDGTHTIEGPTSIPTAGLVLGDNVLAVELHASSTTSSDAVFGAQLVALVSSCAPSLTIMQSGNNVILVWPDPTFSLQSATDVAGPYSTIPGAVSGYSTPITGNAFFQLFKP